MPRIKYICPLKLFCRQSILCVESEVKGNDDSTIKIIFMCVFLRYSKVAFIRP